MGNPSGTASENCWADQLISQMTDNPSPVLLLDARAVLIDANPGSWLVMQQWGIERGEPLPAPWSATALAALEHCETREGTLSAGPVSISLLFLPLPAAGRVCVLGVDVTSRKHLEQMLELNAQVFESASEGILIMDPDLRVINVNSAYGRITGYPPEEVLGETAAFTDPDFHHHALVDDLLNSLTREGSWQGEIRGRHRNGEHYAGWLSVARVRDAGGQLTHYTAVLTDITRQKEAEDQLVEMAHYYDVLTGLPNRRLCEDRLAQAITAADRSGESFGALLINLDGFKLVNEHLGHRSGDRVLRIVAERIKSCVREADTLARMGGDEFLLLLHHLDEPDSVQRAAETILTRVAEPVTLDDQEFFLTASIGISGYTERQSSEQMLRQLNSAMYSAKASGKNGYQLVSEDPAENLGERLIRQAKLRRAIESGEIVAHYQTIVDLTRGTLAGLEVLARWDSPGEGLLGPDTFISLAEESGLIRDLGEHILRTACTQGALWRAEGLCFGLLSINVSAYQLRDADFVDRVECILTETGFPPAALDLELSEAVWIEDRDNVVTHLERLRELGVTVSIDDFGTKYASLAYLKHLPIDRLKIDKSFVDDIPADSATSAIIASIMAMAHAIGLEVVAEGVEYRSQLEHLHQHGCRLIQGYYFCRPAPAILIPELVSRPTLYPESEGPPKAMSDKITFTVKPDWGEIARINDQTRAFLASTRLPVTTIDTYTMVICELLENGIKYGRAGELIEVSVSIGQSSINIQVNNAIADNSRSHLRELDRTLQWIRGVQDPYQAYLERIREISREPMDMSKSCLGLIRIAYEGRASLDFILDDNDRLSVYAMAPYSPTPDQPREVLS